MEAEPAQPNATGMTDAELASLCAAHEVRAVGYYNSEIAAEQAKAINYYYGIMDDLPVLEGCSSVVSHSVSVMVDNALAAILKPFVSADEVVSFEPRSSEDVAQAEQATEYVNYVINCDNPGFLIFHDWFKDALLTKIGVVKVWWEDRSQIEVAELPADAAGLLALREDENYLGESEIAGEAGEGLFSVRVQRLVADGRVKVENVPPEEFLITPFARSLDCAYVAHKPSNFTRSDLIEMGVEAEIADSLPAAAAARTEESRSQARYRDEDWSASDRAGSMADKSRDVLDILDEYVRCDFDGDGISELRRVVRVGDVILLNEEVEECPFALLCPVPMPHKVYGRSIADQAVEGQKVSTAVLRSTLDNLYKSNNPRPEIPDTAVNDNTFDDILDSSPGAAIRTKLPGQLNFFQVPFSADKSFAMLEAIAQNIEERTGFQRKGNGFNAEALKKNSPATATQAAIDENSRNERAEMIARIFAETGVKQLFRLILKLLVNHQPRERMIRLRNQWVAVDPRDWNPDMDLVISVGLGIGNRMEQIGQAEAALQAMQRVGATPFAHLITAGNVINGLKKLYTALGIKNAGDFYTEQERGDDGQLVGPAAPPDPDMVRAQAEAQARAAELEARQQEAAARLQVAQQEGAARIELARAEAEAKLEARREEFALKAELERQKAQFEADLAVQKMEREFQLEQRRIEMEANRTSPSPDRGPGQASRLRTGLSENRDGGDLSQ